MSALVIQEVVNAAGEEQALSSEVRAIIVGALAGETELDHVLSAPSSVAFDDSPPPAASSGGTRNHIYLESITARGFRGIAGEVVLRLDASPGLTIVTGRNGSGKSSFAEAAELALGGTSRRSRTTGRGQEGLSNLHEPGDTSVSVTLRIDGLGLASLGCSFPKDRFSDLAVQVDVSSLPEAPWLEQWREAVELYRPVLTYEELATLMMHTAKEKDLFDSIDRIIGLDGLTAADKRLTTSGTLQKGIVANASTSLADLIERLNESKDPRSLLVREALSGSQPDLDSARGALTASPQAKANERRTLTGWAAVEVASESDVEAALALWSEADVNDRAIRVETAGEASRLAEILALALAYHEHATDNVCPVCHTGVLDENWRTAATAALTQANILAQSAKRRSREPQEHASQSSRTATARASRADACRRSRGH